MDDDELFSDEDMKLIDDALAYRIKWLKKYIDKHDKFGGAEEAKAKRSKFIDLRWRIRQDVRSQ